MRKIIKFISWISVFVLCSTILFSASNDSNLVIAAEKNMQKEQSDNHVSLSNLPETTYESYMEKHKNEIYQGEQITYHRDKSLIDHVVQVGEEEIVYIDVKKAGVYVLAFDYKSLEDNILQTSLSLKINGQYPYSELKRLKVNDKWISSEVTLDRYGNETMGMPTKDKIWNRSYLHDTSFLYSTPLYIYLEEGNNELRFSMNEGSIEIGNIYLESYEELHVGTSQIAAGDQIRIIEAEDITYKNSPNIRATSEYNTNVTPIDPKYKIYNLILDSSFKTGGNQISYEFEVSESGYYHVGFDYRQNMKADLSVYRNIYINGMMPSLEYQNMAFPYSKNFQRLVNPQTVYLEQGKNTLTIEVSLDYMRNAIQILTQLTKEMNDLALSINKITGGNTDKYRDFNLEPYGFQIEGKLSNWAEQIDLVYEEIGSLNPQVEEIGELSQLKIASNTLKKLAENPNELPQKLNQFSYGTSSARQYLNNVIEKISVSELGLDKILFFQEEAELPSKLNWIETIGFKIKYFFASFTQDDYAPNYEKDNETLQIWVARPRQYLEIMQRMADSDFTKKYNINVEISIVPDQQKLILANASGKAPDAAIGIGSGLVYDLALRGALVNMREFDNFTEVGNRFAPGMLIPGVSDTGVYAIPETFNFSVLFYRKDIMESIGLEIPNTMDEVRKILPELARLGLGFNSHVANFPVKGFNTTMPFIYQNGGTIMNSNELKSSLDSNGVFSGLKALTENFTVYDMDYEILSFYQAFRDGRIPLGTSDYSTYNLLINAAPEISDAWEIAPYPGVVNEQGEVVRYTSGAAESCVVFSGSNMTEDAWLFVDWWMSTEIQTEFAYTLQSTLGNEYLWNSANLEAIEASPWSKKHKDVIIEQLAWTYEAPRVPGSYIIERELGNIVNRVVTQNVNLRSAIDDSDKKINRELQRKLEEFGYIDGNGKQLKELIVPDIEMIRRWLNE